MTTYRPSCQLIFACVLGMSLTDTAAAYYSPTLGRFLSRDPLNYVDGPALYRAYFVPSGRDPSGKGKVAKSTCQKAVDSMLKESPIKDQLDRLDKIDKCKRPTIKCDDCLAGEAGGYDPRTNTIKICTDFPDDADIFQDIQDTLIHELIHKSDDCQWPLPGTPTCRQWLCIEARAISCSNDCPSRADDPDCVQTALQIKMAYDQVHRPDNPICPKDPFASVAVLKDVLADDRCLCKKPCGESAPSPPTPPPGYGDSKK